MKSNSPNPTPGNATPDITEIPDISELRGLYERLCWYVGFTGEDAACLVRILPFVEPCFSKLVEDFYEAIEREPETAKVFTGGPRQVARLKVTLLDWLHELFSGRYDDEYIIRRWRVGKRHVDIGLGQMYTNVALSRLRSGLLTALCHQWPHAAAELLPCVNALNRRLDLDLALIEDAYRTEYLHRQQKSERMATIGQVAGGVAHELRNPLNVVKTSVYYLRNARSLSPEKLNEHLQRIERQVGLADGVITALNDFAKLPLPEFRPVRLAPYVAEILEDLELADNIVVSVRIAEDIVPVLADERQLGIVLRNLVCNARDAMPQGGNLTIAAQQEAHRVRVDVRDSGIGMTTETMQRILEPLYSTKARGIGLGLSITRAILEKHQSSLSVSSVLGEGSTFSMTLLSQPQFDPTLTE